MKPIDKNFSELEKNIDTNFFNKNLLIQSFTHRSYINENSKIGLNHNERLEFLGDAVLELIVTKFLFEKYPDYSEGELTAYRAALVNTNTLSEIAKNLNFNDYLFLSRGESKDLSRARVSILADTYEALIGAIFLDKNYEAVKYFVEKTLIINMEKIIEDGKYKDAKSQIQEISQEKLQITPNYKVLKESGPDHNKRFIISICFGEKEIAQGDGNSKQEAETAAAYQALLKLKWIK